jgi:beta-aspartyl-peptidase (threonine type)
MNKWLVQSFVLILVALISCVPQTQSPSEKPMIKPEWAIVIHGGAGNINPADFTPEKEKAYKDKLVEALETGGNILKNGGTSLDAVEASIRVLEDSPLFNAGQGAVFNADGINELDASIMDGKNLGAGAVANVRTVKNPISAARKVMENSPHVMLIKDGAEKFAEEQELEIVDQSYFFTQERWDALQKAKQQEREQKPDETKKIGTVGAVALDNYGNLAAGTSTGGMTNKKYGRVGDSPIIGAGTYANNATCGVSATGHGEYFIKNVVAFDISARMQYLGESLDSATNYIVNTKLKTQNASGGLVAMDKNGNISMPFNSTGMFRGFLKAGEETRVFIFHEN